MEVEVSVKNAAGRAVRRSMSTPLAAAAALLVVTACRRDEITHYRVPKEAPSSFAGAGDGVPGGTSGGSDVPPPAAPQGASALRWNLPKGWTESVAGGMRYATLKPSVPGRIDVSVIVLPGPAGGELANVNRWRGQIGLAAVDEAALASMRKTLRTQAGTVSVYDFTSDGADKSRMVAALAFADGNTWFIKMVGGAEPVGAARPDFIRLLESLHFDAANN